MKRRHTDVLREEHKGSLWINPKGHVWAWVWGDWRRLRNSGLWSGLAMYSGEGQMKNSGPFIEVDCAKLEGT